MRPDFVVIKILTGNPTAARPDPAGEEHAWSQEQAVFRGGNDAAVHGRATMRP